MVKGGFDVVLRIWGEFRIDLWISIPCEQDYGLTSWIVYVDGGDGGVATRGGIKVGDFCPFPMQQCNFRSVITETAF